MFCSQCDVINVTCLAITQLRKPRIAGRGALTVLSIGVDRLSWMPSCCSHCMCCLLQYGL